jgi:hypothetical protein
LISPRGVERNDRFPHIKKILDDNKFPECFGEMYIPNGNVFDVSSSVNWSSALFMPIDLMDKTIPYQDRFKIINEKVAQMNNSFITPLVIFDTVEKGWEYVKETNGEGLVIRNPGEWYKAKILK